MSMRLEWIERRQLIVIQLRRVSRRPGGRWDIAGDIRIHAHLILRDDVAGRRAVESPLLVRVLTRREEVPDLLGFVSPQVAEPTRTEIQIATLLIPHCGEEIRRRI